MVVTPIIMASVAPLGSTPNGGSNSKPSEDDRSSSRNFRAHYYEKVGFRGVDERRTLDTLLREDPVSQSKCACFSLNCSVPADRRLLLWKLVCGKRTLFRTPIFFFPS